jgi:NadR type nicotinamide-nucleotide adenylyltransferase
MEKRERNIIKVAVVGPESTGKTTLCEQLATYYNTIYVPEFAREYLNSISRPYTLQDVLHIANEQAKLVNEFEKKVNSILFCDTSLITIKIWLNVKYNYFNAELENKLLKENTHFYLLTKPDIPWKNDGLREHPHFRNELFNMHVDILNKLGFNYKIISGDENLRFENAIQKIENIKQYMNSKEI